MSAETGPITPARLIQILNGLGIPINAQLAAILAQLDIALSTRASEATIAAILVQLDVALSTRASEATLATLLNEAQVRKALREELGEWRELLYNYSKWVKGNNVVIDLGAGADFDANSVADPAVRSFAGYGYRCLYVGQNAAVLKGGLIVEEIGAAVKDMTAVLPAWAKAGINPIIIEAAGLVAWDSLRVNFPCFFYDQVATLWKYWYAGAPVDAATYLGYPLPTGAATDFIGIGYASHANPPEITAPTKSPLNPIITRDMVATALGLNVVTDVGAILAPWVAMDEYDMYHMWFGVQIGPDFRYRVLYATSNLPDSGWVIHGSVVFYWGHKGSFFDRETGVLRPERIGNIWMATFDGGQVHTMRTQTGLAFSVDGLYWMPLPTPVIPLGDEGSFDCRYASVASMCPLISREGYGLYMLYWGNDGTLSKIGEVFCIVSDYLPRQILHNAAVLDSAVANTSRRVLAAPYLKKTLLISATKTLAPGDLTVSVQIADEDVAASYITPSGFSKTFSATGSEMIEWETYSTFARVIIQAASGDATNYWTVTTKLVGGGRNEA